MSHRCRWRLEDPPPPVSLPGAVTDAAAAPPPLMLCRARRKGLRAPAPTPASRPLLPRPAPSPPNPLLAPSSSPVALPYPSEPWAGVSATPMTGDACTAARAGGQAVEAAGTSSGSGVYMRMPACIATHARTLMCANLHACARSFVRAREPKQRKLRRPSPSLLSSRPLQAWALPESSIIVAPPSKKCSKAHFKLTKPPCFATEPALRSQPNKPSSSKVQAWPLISNPTINSSNLS
eukprot:111199-Pelagomonas_calceolata.AAC.3